MVAGSWTSAAGLGKIADGHLAQRWAFLGGQGRGSTVQLLPKPLTGPPARRMPSRSDSSQGTPTDPAGKCE